MSIAPVLGKFLQSVVVPEGVCTAEAQCMLALIDVIELLMVASYGKVADQTILDRAIDAHLALQFAAYGEGLWRPKMHYVLHLVDMLIRLGWPSMVAVQERNHRSITGRVRDRHGDCSFDTGVLCDVTAQNLHDIALPFRGSVLIDARAAPPRLRRAIISSAYACEADKIMTPRGIRRIASGTYGQRRSVHGRP
jgi:hypothetical protein